MTKFEKHQSIAFSYLFFAVAVIALFGAITGHYYHFLTAWIAGWIAIILRLKT
jgi:hypothetical protein